ncbi:efflux transporter outer membrane subunit [Crenobacter sp. SG2305]|uniref:efflux transporter outer membrane subunit n=1 Tax=Crenobacter oryzisoli TaxID=3056844 RepID=UPI0025AB12AD|nr:efflux transporter outer membrane subunit [Crenobacter sp. SG2305]MDN0085021.1 efflux transporter outer membrane subunit [Crenobacter sp. SG2305]
MTKRLLPAVVALALAGCAVGPDYSRPKFDMPDSWAAQNSQPGGAVGQTAEAGWWKRFNDPVLDQLVDEALSYNQDLAAAAARVDQAAAQAGIARAALLPSLDYNANFTRGRVSAETAVPGTLLVSDVRTVNGVLSWELDLWGKLRRSSEAARANFVASRYNRDAVELSLASQVTNTYFQLRALDVQLKVTEQTLATREESLRLQQKRYRGGLISALDLHQAESEEASSRAAVPQLKQSVEQTEHALSVLTGRSPRDLLSPTPRGKELAAMAIPPVVPEGLPSTLLTRRPDVAAAEQQLVAANAQIGVARAAYFPTISLTGAIGSQSLSLSGLFTGPAKTWSFVGGAAGPIFNWGATGYGVDAATGGQKQALATYQSAVQNAFRDTLDALSAINGSAKSEVGLVDQLHALRETQRLAQLRYDNGYSSYLEVLDAERNTYSSELNVINARLARLNAAVSLYKALGGGWSQAAADAQPDRGPMTTPTLAPVAKQQG